MMDGLSEFEILQVTKISEGVITAVEKHFVTQKQYSADEICREKRFNSIEVKTYVTWGLLSFIASGGVITAIVAIIGGL